LLVPYGFAGDGKDLPAGATAKTYKKARTFADKLGEIDKLKEGP
jgi:hypothetical protein